MNLLDTAIHIGILVGAVIAVRDVWFKGELEPIVTLRARVELIDNKIGYLLTCPLCLTYYISLLLLFLYFVPAYFVGDWYRYFFYWLSVVGYSNCFLSWNQFYK